MQEISLNTNSPVFSPAVQAFLASSPKMLIGGQFVDSVSGKQMSVQDPATGQIVTQVPEGESADIDLAVAAARSAFETTWRDMPARQRGRLLMKLADLLEKHIDELSQLEALDVGKTISMARYVDLPLAIDTVRYYAGLADKLEGTTLSTSVPYTPGARYFAYTLREPVGVAGLILPWNFPLLLALMKVAPALAAGCTVIIKPAEDTPLTTLRFGMLAMEAEIPAGVINIVPGYGPTAGAALAAHPGVDKVAFTGSTEVGKLIVQAAAGNLKKVTLELGGKSPNIIFADADLPSAIAGAAAAIFTNQGEFCTAGSRLYVHESVFQEVVAGVSAQARWIALGHGLHAGTQMGPMVSKQQRDRIADYVDSGRMEGAEIVVGGRSLEGPGYFYTPTIITKTTPSMKIVREEIFGPVVTAIPFTSDEEIPIVANDTMYGLAAAIWTRDIGRAHRMAARMNAGTVWINTYHVYDPTMPFGGYRQSGWGREFGHEGIFAYTQTKSVCVAL